MDDDDDDGKGGGGGVGETTARRRVLTVRIPIEHHHHEEAKNTGRGRGGEKILFETMDKVFASVLETSEIRARDVKATRDAREEGERERKTYRYRAPAPRFPFVPKSIGALSETGTCEVTEVVVYDFKRKRVENSCETKGMRFADHFVVESFVGVKNVRDDKLFAVVCTVDVRLRWLKRLDNQRWLETLVTKATEMKIRKKYAILMKRVANDLRATAKTVGRSDVEAMLHQKMNYLFCLLVSILIFSFGYCLGRIDASLSAILKIK